MAGVAWFFVIVTGNLWDARRTLLGFRGGLLFTCLHYSLFSLFCVRWLFGLEWLGGGVLDGGKMGYKWWEEGENRRCWESL